MDDMLFAPLVIRETAAPTFHDQLILLVGRYSCIVSRYCLKYLHNSVVKCQPLIYGVTDNHRIVDISAQYAKQGASNYLCFNTQLILHTLSHGFTDIYHTSTNTDRCQAAIPVLRLA